MISGSLIADVPAVPKVATEQIPGLPSELQPAAGDVLLASPLWPWQDLGAKSVPEQWLYMSRHTQGVIALLTVQTPAGPRLVRGNSDGSIVTSFPQTPTTALVDVTLGAGGGLFVAGRLAGKTIYVYSYSIDMQEDPVGALATAWYMTGDNSNAIVVAGRGNTTRHWALSFPVPFALGPTDALVLSNNDSVQHSFSGVVQYKYQ